MVVVEKKNSFNTKKGIITQYLIADETASIFMNFFDQMGSKIKEGDILYMSGVYASKYKQKLLLYQGEHSLIKRVGRYFLKFNLSRNLSEESL